MTHAEDNSLLSIFIESVCSGDQPIGAHRHEGEAVVAIGIGDHLLRNAGGEVGQRDVGADDYPLGSIRDVAVYGSVDRIRLPE